MAATLAGWCQGVQAVQVAQDQLRRREAVIRQSAMDRPFWACDTARAFRRCQALTAATTKAVVRKVA